MGVLGVNSTFFIGCYQCVPISDIVGLDRAFLIYYCITLSWYIIYHFVLSVLIDVLLVAGMIVAHTAKKPQKPKEQEPHTTKGKKLLRSREDKRHKSHKARLENKKNKQPSIVFFGF